MIRGQLIRFLFSETLENDYHYTMNFVITTQNTMDYAWYRWGNDFGSGGILLGSSYISQQPNNGQTLNQSYIPFSNYNLYSKTSSITFDVTPSSTNTFALDIPTYLYSYSQICLDSYTIQKGNSQSSEQNTQTIINNNNQNTQNIITNNNQNTQSIINNQNENTQQQIESQKVCTDSFYSKSNTNVSPGFLDSNGSVIQLSNWFYTTDFINIKNATNIKLTGTTGSSPHYCLYNADKSLNRCVSYGGNSELDISITNESFIRFSIYNNLDTSLSFEVCKNGNQAISDNINDLNNTLQDTSIEGSSIASTLEDIESISDTPISDLLTLPIIILQRLYNSVSGSCTPYLLDIGFWGGSSYVTFPCINLGHEKYLGRIVWGIIDDLFCIFMIWNIFKLVIWFYSSWTTLKDNFEYLIDPSNGGMF